MRKKLSEANIELIAKNIVLLIVFLALFTFVVAIIPKNRFVRAIKKADKYYVTMKYDKAEKKYQKAVKIKPDFPQGYIGIIDCMMARGEEADKTFLGYADHLLKNGDFSKNQDDYIEFFLLTNEILAGNQKSRREVLSRAYNSLLLNEGLKISLSDACFDYGIEVAPSSIDEALSSFDEAIALGELSSVMKEKMGEIVHERIKNLVDHENYDGARDVLSKYSGSLSLDYESIFSEIKNEETLYNIKCELMKSLSEAMAGVYTERKASFSEENVRSSTPVFGILNMDLNPALSFDGSKAAETLAYSFERDAYIYAEGGFKEAYTGVGCGLYTYGDVVELEDGSKAQGYYFYYGEYKAGIRDGFGYLIAKNGDNSFVAFEGIWQNDAPNGFGVLYEKNMYSENSQTSYTRVTFGEFVDGLINGVMTARMFMDEFPDVYFEGEFKSAKGTPYTLSGRLIDYGIVERAPKGQLLYAILSSSTDGDELFVPLFTLPDVKIGALGF